MKSENPIAPVTMNGLAGAGIFGAARHSIDAPRITVTMNEVPQAIFTSGARSIERNVPNATAAACSGTTYRCPDYELKLPRFASAKNLRI